MLKASWLFLLLIFISINSYAVEPVLDQQGMFYFSMTFDAGQSTKTEHDFGFRLDRTLVQPGETMTMQQLADKPAVFNLKMNNNGLKAFELNGVDYSTEYYVSRAEGEEAEAQPKKSVDIPVGVIVGVLIGTVAVVSGF
jgi:LPS O-antigen subunit length determinant protein (WzzB/FepE family)